MSYLYIKAGKPGFRYFKRWGGGCRVLFVICRKMCMILTKTFQKWRYSMELPLIGTRSYLYIEYFPGLTLWQRDWDISLVIDQLETLIWFVINGHYRPLWFIWTNFCNLDNCYTLVKFGLNSHYRALTKLKMDLCNLAIENF